MTTRCRRRCAWEDYGGEDEDEYGSWVLLESTAPAGGEAEGDAPAAAPEAAESV